MARPANSDSNGAFIQYAIVVLLIIVAALFINGKYWKTSKPQQPTATPTVRHLRTVLDVDPEVKKVGLSPQDTVKWCKPDPCSMSTSQHPDANLILFSSEKPMKVQVPADFGVKGTNKQTFMLYLVLDGNGYPKESGILHYGQGKTFLDVKEMQFALWSGNSN